MPELSADLSGRIAVTRARRAAVDAFVRRHYSLRGSLRLHRRALGWDLLRAPLNVSLAPVFLLVRLAALVARVARLRGAGQWLAARQILFETSVTREVEALVLRELLADRAEAVEADKGMTVRRLVSDYAAVRSPVAEITCSAAILVLGLLAYEVVTPGVISLAPLVSEQVARSSAVADFPLGTRLGAAWYGIFPVSLPVWFVVAVGVVLAIAASLFTTFAGLVADPVQAALGIHRRRLLRLLGRVDEVMAGGAAAPRTAEEHILARGADIVDTGLTLLRHFRP